MQKHMESAARLLGSAAMRYDQPFGPNRMPFRRSGGGRRDDLRRRVELLPIEQTPPGGVRSQPGVEGIAELANLEAVLFVAREPLGSRRLAQFAGLADGTQARTLVRRLNRLYDEEQSAFRVVEVAGGYQLLSRGKFAPWLRRLHGTLVEVRLSAPMMETLAVVAYRQPVLRAQIESIRGVACGEILRQLMERDLVKIAGRSDDLGRPFLYGTTRRFLQVFGLRHLDDLPQRQGAQARQADTIPCAVEGTGGAATTQTNQTVDHTKTEGGSNVKIDIHSTALLDDAARTRAAGIPAGGAPRVTAFDEADDDVGDDEDDLDDEDDDLEDDEDEDDDDLDDDDFDDDWQQVDDDDLDDDEDDDLDDDDLEDDDLDDDDDDWDDDEDEEEEWEDEDE